MGERCHYCQIEHGSGDECIPSRDRLWHLLESAEERIAVLEARIEDRDKMCERLGEERGDLATECERLRERYDVGRIEVLMNKHGAIPGDWRNFFDDLQNGDEAADVANFAMMIADNARRAASTPGADGGGEEREP